MRPSQILLSLLALAALGGILYFALGREASTPEVAFAPSGSAPAEAPVKPGELVAPSAPPASSQDGSQGAERTSIAPTPGAEQAAPKPANSTTLTGRLVDAAGQPVPGVEVRARLGDFDLPEPAQRPGEAPRQRGLTAKSDALGKFEIAGVKPGSVRLNTECPGYVPLSRPGVGIPAVARHDIGDLTLETSVILEGRVVDSHGVGVGGARLVRPGAPGTFSFDMSGGANEGPALAVSEADGSFRIDQLASGPWRLQVVSEAHPDKFENGTTKRPGERVGGLSFQLEDGFEISGRVTGVPAGSLETATIHAFPAAQREIAFLRVEDDSTGPNRRKAKLSGDGSFVVRGLRAGSYQLQARTPNTSQEFFLPRSASERVEAKTGDRGVLIAWQPASILTFQAVDAASGEPIEQLVVTCATRMPMMFMDPRAKEPRKYEAGQVQVDDLRPRDANDRATLDVTASGYAPLHMEDIVLNRGGVTDLGKLEFARTATVDVRVVDAATRGALAGARVELHIVEGPGGEGGGGFSRARRTVTVDNDDVSFGDGPSSVVRTDDQGLARLNSKPQKRGKVSVSLDGYAPYSSDVFDLPGEGSLQHDVALDAGGAVEITLLTADGAPVSGARIDHRAPNWMDNPFGDPLNHGKDPATDAEGKVTLTNLAVGTHRFRPAKAAASADLEEGVVFSVSGMDDGSEWSDVVVVRATTAKLVLREPRLAEVHGVVREGAAALPGASLSLRKQGGDQYMGDLEGMPFGGGGGPRAKSDGEGRYRFEKVEPGSYVLSVRHATRSMAAKLPVVVTEEGLEFDVQLPVSVIEGRVLDHENKPVAGAKVWVERARVEGEPGGFRMFSIALGSDEGGMVFDSASGMDASKARTDAEGRFTLRGVESDADLVVRADVKDCEPASSETFRVAPDQTRRGVDITVTPAGQIQVKVVSAASRPGPAMVHAEFLDVDDLPEGKKVDPKNEFVQGGTVTLRGLRPGKWKLYAEPLGGSGGGESTAGEAREVVVVAHETASVDLPIP